jgi:hypothetical protein
MQQVSARQAPQVHDYLALKAEQARREFFNPSCVR